MPRVMVWDVPVRLFHVLFGAGIVAASAIALLGDDDSPLYPYHMLVGLTLALMVALRIVWGFVGTRYARFGSFLFTPAEVLGYLASILRGSPRRHVGHNPGSAYAILAMFALTIGLAVTGLMMENEVAKDLHEIMAYVMVAVVAAHLVGVAVHTVVHRENITRSMMDGRKAASDGEAIPHIRPIAALLSLAVVAAFAVMIVRDYDPIARTTRLPLVGMSVAFGESEGGERGERDDDD